MNARHILALMALLATTSALAATPGDLNEDGRIDDADLDVMRVAFFSADTRADLNRDGRVDFADLALLKAARVGHAPDAGETPPAAPAVYLLPETPVVTLGEPLAVDLYWDFTGDPTLGGGTDFAWDPNAFALVSIVFDDNFGTGPGQFDPAFTRCDNEPCSGPGFIDDLATGNFNGLAGEGPIYIATMTFSTLQTGTYSIALSEGNGIAGPFVSAEDFGNYPNLSFAGSEVAVGSGEPGPVISVVPPQVVFPDTVIGETASAPVRVSNIGDLPLTIESVSSPQPPFTLSFDGCSGQVVPPAEGCDLTLDFAPIVTDPAASSIAITSNDPNRPEVTVTLRGTGVPVPAPDIDARPVVGFPGLRVGQTTNLPFIVRNAGTGVLDIGQVAAGNPLESPFSISADNCSNSSLSPNQVCVLNLVFSPVDAGLAVGDFDIPSNDADEPSLVVRLRATAEPRITLAAFGILIDTGRCNNRATGQSIRGALDGPTALPCERIGLVADSGDAVSIFVRGAAQSATAIGGHGLGMTVGRVRCVNQTTGQVVNINPPGPAIDWNCVGGGLSVTPGDSVSMTVFGDAL